MRCALLPALAFGLLIPGAVIQLHAEAGPAASAEVKVGTAVEKMELQGESADFKVPSGTKIWVWTRVKEAGDSVFIAFEKGGNTVFKQELKVPHSPYRTHAYRTFRSGDGGAWKAVVLGADGKELGSAVFTVEITQ